jgi:hypothetical protein
MRLQGRRRRMLEKGVVQIGRMGLRLRATLRLELSAQPTRKWWLAMRWGAWGWQRREQERGLQRG